ncbi:MAG: hypothetical protein ACRCYR_10620 [Phycicoccus sp.]
MRDRIVRWEKDAEKALADIDRLSTHYDGQLYGVRDRLRISCWVEVERWHGWGHAKPE